MNGPNMDTTKVPLNAQKDHWERMFTKNTDMFGTEPSYPARKAAEMFKREGKKRILELGGGQGRDTLFFAQQGFQIYTLDYSREGIKKIMAKANKFGLSQSVVALRHDVREALPFDDDFFDGCYTCYIAWPLPHQNLSHYQKKYGGC